MFVDSEPTPEDVMAEVAEEVAAAVAAEDGEGTTTSSI